MAVMHVKQRMIVIPHPCPNRPLSPQYISNTLELKLAKKSNKRAGGQGLHLQIIHHHVFNRPYHVIHYKKFAY